MESLRRKIINFLKTHPPIRKRRTWWNIAINIGEQGNREVLIELNHLVAEGKVKHRSAKNMAYWIEDTPGLTKVVEI